MTAIEELTLRMAVLQIRKNQISSQLDAARLEAQAAYRPHRLRGNKTVTPVLPGGAEAGSVAIKAGVVRAVFDEAKLLELIGQCEPENVEDWVAPAALADKRVIDLIREHLPELVQKRVNAARRPELAEACIESGGFLADANGEKVRVADIERAEPTGEFAYTPGHQGTAAILQALRDGTVTEDGRVAAVPADGGAE